MEVGTPSIQMRSYFSTYHLASAKHFGSLAKLIEDNLSGRLVFDINHRSYVIAAVLASVAFLEAAINELYQDAADNRDGCMEFPTEKVRHALSVIWSNTEAKNKTPFSILDKYQLALSLASLDQFKIGTQPYQDAALVIKVRNSLVHYKPESVSANEVHKFEQKLKGKFRENRLMETSENPYYPDKLLGYGCAAWSVESASKLADKFFKRIGIVPNYQKVQF